MKPLVLGLAGCGTVGGGLLRLLETNADMIVQRTGRPIVVKRVLGRDTPQDRSVPLPEGTVFTTDPAQITDDPDIDVLVELIGGTGVAGQLIGRALDQGKHVVTANKALLAELGQPLFIKAAEKGLILRHEASVCGAIPIVEALRDSMAGNAVTSLMGILNGTSNYILSAMAENGLDFEVALKEAQRLGYAEADPTLDIDGQDAAHKLTLLIRLAFGVHYPYEKLYVRGIRNMSALDIQLAAEFGYNIKLIGQVRAHNEDGLKLEAGVFPTLVDQQFLLASVAGVFNAVRVDGNAAGSLFFHGRGAGSLPTAGAVLADIMAVAREEHPNNTGFVAQDLPPATILPADAWQSAYYARTMVRDRPGVLRDICACLANEGISLARVMQKTSVGNAVPLVLMTHQTSASAMNRAMQAVADLGILCEDAVFYRVLQ